MDTTTFRLAEWSADESGVTALEYGLLAGLIGVAIIAGVSATGTALTSMYAYWSSAVLAALS